uniref:Uncharacterized protein n=1 Tax=Vitis vinifera TaxID=29760 RepID=F6H9F1_VITVI
MGNHIKPKKERGEERKTQVFLIMPRFHQMSDPALFQRKLVGQKTRNHNVEGGSDAENHEDYIKVI